MKKIIFFFTLVLASNNVMFSQNISGEVEYEISYYQCTKCKLTGKIKELYSILKVSDFHYLPQIYFTALEGKGLYGCTKSNYCAQGGDHSTVESDPPTYEKQRIENVSKSRYYGQEINMSRLQEVSKKINSDFTKWKKIYDEEQAKKHTEKVKEQKEIETAKKAKIEEQRLQYQPKLDSLINENKFKEAATYIFQIQKNIESDIYWDFRKYYTVKIYSYFITFLDNNQFQLFDEEFQKLRKNSIYNICNDSLLDKRIFKEKDFEINKIQAKTISSEEILLVGDWSFVSINGYVMRIILERDRTFHYSCNWELKFRNGGPYRDDYFWMEYGDKPNYYGLKGYWKLNNGTLELVASEEYGYHFEVWKKTKQNNKLFIIQDFKKNKLFIEHKIPKYETPYDNVKRDAFVIEFKGKRSKEK